VLTVLTSPFRLCGVLNIGDADATRVLISDDDEVAASLNYPAVGSRFTASHYGDEADFGGG
jgi:hypothetical protein